MDGDQPHRLMVGALAVSALGAWLHNGLEGIPTWSPETMSAVLPTVVLAAWWWRGENRILRWVTVVWVLGLHLVVGALLSVLPLPIWPFVPDQDLGHYLAHILYATTQLPALHLLWRSRPA
ncbi:hypothetical protein BH23ACT5_BH23ACT5_15930 [soil metagenome]